MNLVVDFGNTTIKAGIFEQYELKETHIFYEQKEIESFIKNTKSSHFIVSSVSQNTSILIKCASHIPKRLVLSHTLPAPITNKYKTPETLGMDRLAGACGAKLLFPNNACLVIDSGTCITYDIVDDKNNYLGGAIAPGLQMRLQAMHTFTARLPLSPPIYESPHLIGDSTLSCLQSGALNGVCAEIEGMITRYKDLYPDIRVILCGGDSQLFENNLKQPIFAAQHLVLSGLNSILLYNVNT